jgi:Asp-tRNA(Asn)/Glu-tRNA(Gln) amidotransferase B subunit
MVMHLAKTHSSNLVKETGIEPSLDEDDIEKYVDEVLKEIHRK